MKKKIKVISLFSGCGGFDLGFKKAGFDIIFANDNEKNLKETYEKNLGHTLIVDDIKKIDKKLIPNGDVIIAGIPCQPFSNAGNRKSTKDKDGNLFLEVIKVINNQKSKPAVIVFENVRGFLSSKDEKGILLTKRFEIEMEKCGYKTQFQLLNASDFGVPSNRYRVFVVCVLKKIKKNFYFPVPQILKQKITVGDIISKPLPNNEIEEVWDLSEATLKSVKFIKEGGSWKDIPDKYLSKAHKKIRKNIVRYRSPNFYRRFSRKEIMGTITATSSPENSGIIHPLKNRRYSVREIARFQSFPDSFKFYGNSISIKYKMIGNAVPPKLAYHIGKAIKKSIF
tara:strand:- start:1205 stop:2221 length:1017 start_codon:yes stop_codon:yes gene_type:complete